MKIDLEYLGSILDMFLEAETAHISLPYMQKMGMKLENPDKPGHLNENFLFHIQLAMENGLISNKDLYISGLDSIGISQSLSGSVTLVDTPIRLTQAGHDFAKALNNRDVLQRLKTEFKDAPFKTIFDGSQAMLQHYFKKKIDQFVDE